MMMSSNTAAVRIRLQANGNDISNEGYWAQTPWTTMYIEGTVVVPANGSTVFRMVGLTSSGAVGTITNATNDVDWVPRLVATIA